METTSKFSFATFLYLFSFSRYFGYDMEMKSITSQAGDNREFTIYDAPARRRAFETTRNLSYTRKALNNLWFQGYPPRLSHSQNNVKLRRLSSNMKAYCDVGGVILKIEIIADVASL